MTHIAMPSGEWITCEGCGERYQETSLFDRLCFDCRAAIGIESRRETAEQRVPQRYRAAFEIELQPPLSEWSGDPWSVTIQGPKGTGKTWTATRLWYEMAGEGALWLDWQTVALSLRDAVTRGESTYDILDELRKASLLLLDDVRATIRKDGQDTDFTAEALRYILSQRYDWMRPTILTMDRPLSEMEPRLASRLRSSIVLKLDGKDRRL